MKTGEIRDMSQDEPQAKLIDLKQSLFNLRFQHEIGQLENPRKMTETRRDIARIKTVIRESHIS